jgi:regulatory protein
MNDFDEAYKMSLKFLDKKLRTEEELRNMLKSRFTGTVIDEVVQKLKYYKFIDDNNYVGCYIRDRIKLNPIGRRKILLELEAKGIAACIIENNEEYKNFNEIELINVILQKKSKQYNLNDRNDKKRLVSYLCRRGFDLENIFRAIDYFE